MPDNPLDNQLPVYDLIGVGFGPSNLALAIAVMEHNATAGPRNSVSARFLESKRTFGWHRGMLIDDATMQVSFLKDLVTMRNPSSEYSFLAYLHDQGRLVDFVNHKNLFPLRIEFHDYFEWAAAKAVDHVSYGCEVQHVRPVVEDGAIVHFDVHSRTGPSEQDVVVHRARNIVLATGLRPNVPSEVTMSDRVWHNSQLLERVESLHASDASRFVVVGAGQSAAEVTAYLHDRFPRSEVRAVFSRYGYTPSDDSPFANRVFDPAAVDDFYAAPEEIKRKILDYHGNTNYSVVDLDLINDLYRREYKEKVLGSRRLRVFNVSRLVDLEEGPSAVRTTVESLATGQRDVLESDVVVYATGYQPSDPADLLGEVDRHCLRDGEGRLRVARDYRVVAENKVHAGVYVQGSTEHTHGITSSLLSNTAVRSGEILDSVLDERRFSTVPTQLVPHSA